MSSALSPDSLRLLMTTDAVGGVWRYSVDLAAALANEGIEVVLAGYGPRPDDAQRAEAEEVACVTWFDLPLDWQAGSAGELADVSGSVQWAADHYAADLVQVNVPSQGVDLALDRPVVAVAHSCVVTWFHAVRGSDVPAGWQWQRDLTRQGLDRADAIVVPSRAFADQIVECYGPMALLRVVANAATPRRRNDEPRQPFAAAAGRWWDDGKNGRVLDAAAALTTVPIRAAGATRGANGAVFAFDHVAHLGPQPHDVVTGLLANAAMAISPSLYEPFGLVALESALAGTPLILSDIPTYRELWDGAALFFAPDDPHALAHAMDRLASDPGLGRTLADNAYARAITLTPQRQAREMAALYRSVLAQQARPQAKVG